MLHANNEYLMRRLKEHLKKKQFAIKDDNIVSDIMDVMLKALDESNYALYANGADIEQKSIKMQEAESNFLLAFNHKAIEDLQSLLKLVRKNNIGRQTTTKANPSEMLSKEREKAQILTPSSKQQFSRAM